MGIFSVFWGFSWVFSSLFPVPGAILAKRGVYHRKVRRKLSIFKKKAPQKTPFWAILVSLKIELSKEVPVAYSKKEIFDHKMYNGKSSVRAIAHWKSAIKNTFGPSFDGGM